MGVDRWAMTPEQIIDALQAARPMGPLELTALLDAASEHAGALAPPVIELAERGASGVYLLPGEENLLHIGLFVLARLERVEVAPALRRLVDAESVILERVFGFEAVSVASSLLVTLHARDPEPLLAMPLDPALGDDARLIAWLALTRLCLDGHVARERMVALLRAFEASPPCEPGDVAWYGWQNAIAYLGLVDLRPSLEAAWADGERLGEMIGAEDRDDILADLAWSAAHPDDPSRLETNEHIAPVTDLVHSLGWLIAEAPAKRGTREATKDPAAAIALDDDEQAWLAGFLASSNTPDTTMPLEALDGFFAALVAGPAMVLPSEYLPVLWGDDEPIFDSPAQAEHVTNLLMRHWNAIAARLKEGAPHVPILFPGTPDQMGRMWARGFLIGMDLRREAWQSLAEAEEEGEVLALIGALIQDEMGDEPIDGEAREDVLRHLGAMVLLIDRFWRIGAVAAASPQPARSSKVGRNAPCPCGSGKKYKKCCGAH
jgi:uncharacterized protein